MSNLTSTSILACCLCLYFYTCRTPKLGKGKVLSQPVARWMLRRLLEKMNRDGFTVPTAVMVILVAEPGSFRCVVQTLPLLAAGFSLWLGFGVDHPFTYYWIVMGVLCADDLLTNTDKPKKWWKAARNKINWKMQLPVPVPSSG